MFLGVERGRCVGLTTLPPPVSRLCIQCGFFNMSQPYRPPREQIAWRRADLFVVRCYTEVLISQASLLSTLRVTCHTSHVQTITADEGMKGTMRDSDWLRARRPKIWSSNSDRVINVLFSMFWGSSHPPMEWENFLFYFCCKYLSLNSTYTRTCICLHAVSFLVVQFSSNLEYVKKFM
jgi:hypothetical protein